MSFKKRLLPSVAVLALTAAAPVSAKAEASWFGEYTGGICVPIDNVGIGADGIVTRLNQPGPLRNPTDFAAAMAKLGVVLQHSPSADETKAQVYILGQGADAVTFRFFADHAACESAVSGERATPEPAARAEAALPAPPASPQTSPTSPAPKVAPSPAASTMPPTPSAAPLPAKGSPLATPPAPAPKEPSPTALSTTPSAAPPSPADGNPPAAHTVWIITVMLGNDPTGVPLARFYRTHRDCLAHVGKSENVAPVRAIVGQAKFRLDCMQLTEANAEKSDSPENAEARPPENVEAHPPEKVEAHPLENVEARPVRHSVREHSRASRHHGRQRAAAEYSYPHPALTNNAPPSERSR
jgi:hypothetical protein